MGKLISYLMMLIVIEILFVTTAQISPAGSGSGGNGLIGSIIFNAILNLSSLSLQEIFLQAIGELGSLFSSPAGVGALILGGAVTLGALFTKNDSILFIPIGFSLAILSLDFVFIGAYLATFNSVLATILMAPIGIIYIMTVLEWIRGKD